MCSQFQIPCEDDLEILLAFWLWIHPTWGKGPGFSAVADTQDMHTNEWVGLVRWGFPPSQNVNMTVCVVYTSCLPTLLLTRAPTPSACSMERTFLTIALAALLIVSVLSNFQSVEEDGWKIASPCGSACCRAIARIRVSSIIIRASPECFYSTGSPSSTNSRRYGSVLKQRVFIRPWAPEVVIADVTTHASMLTGNGRHHTIGVSVNKHGACVQTYAKVHCTAAK